MATPVVEAATQYPANNPPRVGSALWLLRHEDGCTLERMDGQGVRVLASLPLRDQSCGGALSTSAQGDVAFLHGQTVWWLPRGARALLELPKPRDAEGRVVTPRIAALTADGNAATIEIIEAEGAASQPDVRLRAWTWTEDSWRSTPPHPARLIEGPGDWEIDPADVWAFGLSTLERASSFRGVEVPDGAGAWFFAAHPPGAGMACLGLSTGALCGGEEGDDELALVPPLAFFPPNGRVDLAASPGAIPYGNIDARDGRLYLQSGALWLEVIDLQTGLRVQKARGVERYALEGAATP